MTPWHWVFAALAIAVALGGPILVLSYIASRTPLRACRVCGCTSIESCAGGCDWAGLDLCSSCVPSPEADR